MKQVANESLLTCCESKASKKTKTRAYGVGSIASGLN